MRGPLPVVLLLLITALAGCSGDTHRPPAGDGGGEPSAPPVEPEPDNAVFQLTFEASGDAAVEVPFPHLDSCLQPEDWMNATPEVSGGVPELKDASEGRTGRVLSLTGRGSVHWSAQLNMTGRSTCQTFRFDPWSIDPDAQGEVVEVRLADGRVSSASVLVRLIRDGCGHATLYDGEPQPGWTSLPGRTIQAGGTDCPS